jgi:hypothetical protein
VNEFIRAEDDDTYFRITSPASPMDLKYDKLSDCKSAGRAKKLSSETNEYNIKCNRRPIEGAPFLRCLIRS